MITLVINGRSYPVDAASDTPLLWIIRERLRLTGTKYGCGIGQCGSCTVHFDGTSVRSCTVPVADAVGRTITTIEGLHPESKHPLQLAWIAEQVPQCGYCQPGQIMQAAAFLAQNPRPTDAEIVEAMRGNLCRCAAYIRIKRAIKRVVAEGAASRPS
jgi:aerobic-type carbon monoxide dehydrogenase small subunit (CoxS/CutS family)